MPLASTITAARYDGASASGAILLDSAVALDVLATSSESSALSEGVYHVANTTPMHIMFSVAGTAATALNCLFMAGERLVIVLEGQKASVIKSAGAVDGIARLTRVL